MRPQIFNITCAGSLGICRDAYCLGCQLSSATPTGWGACGRQERFSSLSWHGWLWDRRHIRFCRPARLSLRASVLAGALACDRCRGGFADHRGGAAFESMAIPTPGVGGALLSVLL
jgi:hypothetical protein